MADASWDYRAGRLDDGTPLVMATGPAPYFDQVVFCENDPGYARALGRTAKAPAKVAKAPPWADRNVALRAARDEMNAIKREQQLKAQQQFHQAAVTRYEINRPQFRTTENRAAE